MVIDGHLLYSQKISGLRFIMAGEPTAPLAEAEVHTILIEQALSVVPNW